MFMNAYMEVLMLMLVILTLILMLLHLNTDGYAYTDADLCVIFMSLCCIIKYTRILLIPQKHST